jgi:methyl-galactoside transport system substrate-binding protein
MKKIKKLLAIAVATVMMTATLVGCGQSKESTGSSQSNSSDVVKVGVCLYKFDDTYISTVRQNLEKIQAENKEKIEFTKRDLDSAKFLINVYPLLNTWRFNKFE